MSVQFAMFDSTSILLMTSGRAFPALYTLLQKSLDLPQRPTADSSCPFSGECGPQGSCRSVARSLSRHNNFPHLSHASPSSLFAQAAGTVQLNNELYAAAQSVKRFHGLENPFSAQLLLTCYASASVRVDGTPAFPINKTCKDTQGGKAQESSPQAAPPVHGEVVGKFADGTDVRAIAAVVAGTWLLDTPVTVVNVTNTEAGRGIIATDTNRLLHTQQQLLDMICSMLVYPAAEQVLLVAAKQRRKWKPAEDKPKAAARVVVSLCGMNRKVGLLSYPEGSNPYPVSEQTKALIDQEMQLVLDQQFERAVQFVQTHRDLIDALAIELTHKQVVDLQGLQSILGKKAAEVRCSTTSRCFELQTGSPSAANDNATLQAAALKIEQHGSTETTHEMSFKEQQRAAIHEIGHVVAARHVGGPFTGQLIKVSLQAPGDILPAGVDLAAYAEFEPIRVGRHRLDAITMLLAGRAAEEVFFGVPSSGALYDLEQATPLAYREAEANALSLSYIASKITPKDRFDLAWDLEARAVMETCYARALEIVREHHEEIQALYLELWHRKALTGAELDQALARFAASQNSDAPGK